MSIKTLMVSLNIESLPNFGDYIGVIA